MPGSDGKVIAGPGHRIDMGIEVVIQVKPVEPVALSALSD